jgi:tRNA uridine 5-carbamoylmethylation protein Kti12
MDIDMDIDMDIMTQAQLILQRQNMIAKMAHDMCWFQNNQHYVIVLRGLPGSGKSVFARQIVGAAAEWGLRAVICSDDDFYARADENLRNNPLAPQLAREFCQRKFNAIMGTMDRNDADFADVVIIDNINHRVDDFAHYKDTARHWTDPFRVFTIGWHNEEEAMRQATRSTHEVTPETLQRLMNEWQPAENEEFVDAIY